MNSLLHDLRYALRTLRRSPGFAGVAVLTLALGIGASTAIFSVVDAVLLRPLPFEAPDRLVTVWQNNPQAGLEDAPVSGPNFLDWQEQNRVFSAMAASAPTASNLTGEEKPERVPGIYVTPNFFSLLGTEPMRGRGFLAEEGRPGGDLVVVLSHGLWQRRFGRDPAAVGRTVEMNGKIRTIVGVLPPEMRFPNLIGEEPEVWMPLALGADTAGPFAQRGALVLSVIGRLKPGVPLERAEREMSAIAARLAEQYPAENTGWDIRLIPLHEFTVGDVRPALLVLLGAVGFLLLIACANVANLLLARATAREREVAVRVALGAGRGRLVRQFLTESVLLALLGGTLGLLIASWGLDVLTAVATTNLPRTDEIGLDRRVLGFAFLVSVAAGAGFGLVPALQGTSPRLHESLKEGGRGGSGGVRGRRFRSALVVSEVALALLLLVGAGLLMQSFLRLTGVEPGFRPAGVLTAQVLLPSAKYPEQADRAAFVRQVSERIRTLPSVQAAGAATSLPLSEVGSILNFSVQGRPPPAPGQEPTANYDAVGTGFFETLGIPLVRGRTFTDGDRIDAPAVIVVNQTFARRFFPGEDPLGKRIVVGDSTAREIVGLVGDVRRAGLDADAEPAMYTPLAQTPAQFVTLTVRTAGDPLRLLSAIRTEVLAVDPDQPLSNVRTMETILSDSVAQPRLNTLLLSIFAVIGFILAAIGIYGVISYSVTQRTRDIGIRMALGAEPRDVLGMVVRQGLRLAAVGAAIGLAAALIGTRVLASMLFGVSATDPWTFAGVALLLGAVALLASYLPARRATRVDPIVALRAE